MRDRVRMYEVDAQALFGQVRALFIWKFCCNGFSLSGASANGTVRSLPPMVPCFTVSLFSLFTVHCSSLFLRFLHSTPSCATVRDEGKA